MPRLRRHLNPAMVVALVALLSSLTGGAIAASMITGKQVKNSSLTGADVKDRSLTGKDLKKSSLGADRLTAAARATLKGSKGDPGAKGDQGIQGIQGVKGDAGTPASTTVTQSIQGGSLEWAVVDPDGTNSNSTTTNAGLSVTSTGGDATRTLFALTTLPSVQLGGTTGKVAALHLCYRATSTIHLAAVGVNRYRGDQLDVSGLQTQTALLNDTTERQDAVCRRYPITGDQLQQVGDSYLLALSIETTTNAGGTPNTLRILSVGVESTV